MLGILPFLLAAVCLLLVLAGAFIAARATQHRQIFALAPPPPKHDKKRVMSPDVEEAKRVDLHRTFFTAWAALVLTIPALCFFPFRGSSSTAAAYWLAFWTAAFLAFAVHFYWSVVVFFGGSWTAIKESTRVSAPIVDTIFFVWWALDVLLAWTVRRENVVVCIEHTFFALVAFVLFVLASVKEGEKYLSRALGWVMMAAVVTSLVWAVTQGFLPCFPLR